MIDITCERGVTGDYDEINFSFFKSICPICKDKRELYVTIKSDDPLVIIVNKVCHADYIAAINKQLPDYLQLKVSFPVNC